MPEKAHRGLVLALLISSALLAAAGIVLSRLAAR
jgi:hypothetical protein